MHTSRVASRHAHRVHGQLPSILVRRNQSNGNAKPGNGGEAQGPPKTRVTRGQDARQTASGPRDGTKGASLYEQLFPDQRQHAAASRETEQELPRIPIAPLSPSTSPAVPRAGRTMKHENEYSLSEAARNARDAMLAQHVATGPVKSVLVLRNASKNLLDEDFRRLVPSIPRAPGWQMDGGDLLKVVPGRDVATLEQLNYYYLIFSSAMAAYTYQGHVTRLHRLVAQQTPRNMLSPIMPPPGYTVAGMDANQAIEIFTLVPPNDSLDLRQLKPPLTPLVDAILHHQGHPSFVNRPNRLPYEARLTMEGPQLHASTLRHIFLLSGIDRGLSWSGGTTYHPQITHWRADAQFVAPSPMSTKRDARKWGYRVQKGKFEKPDVLAAQEVLPWMTGDDADPNQQRRTMGKVFIIGFETEDAMKSFVHFWHRKPLVAKGFPDNTNADDEHGDLPPVAHVEALW